MKEHTWQVASWQGGALQLEKSDGKIVKPGMCVTEAWKQLNKWQESRNVQTGGNLTKEQFLKCLDTSFVIS